MSAPVLTFFNNKGGVGKTSLVYHLAWMFASLGKRVLAVDLDPQTNLTAAFLKEDRIEDIWASEASGSTIYQCVEPITGVGDLSEPSLYTINENLSLLPGDMRLSSFEDTLSDGWPRSLSDTNLYRPMRILSSFWQLMQMAAQQTDAEIILADIGPNLGAINRSALIATNYVLIPLGADLFSLQGLKNLGPALEQWKKGWTTRLGHWKESEEAPEHPDFELPPGEMQPTGYLCQQPGLRLGRPVKAYDKWLKRIPEVYRSTMPDAVSGDCAEKSTDPEEDPHCLAIIKHYHSLVPMAQERRKPIFELRPADGAIGAHASAVQDAGRDFEKLARKIAERIGVSVEGPYDSIWEDSDLEQLI